MRRTGVERATIRESCTAATAIAIAIAVGMSFSPTGRATIEEAVEIKVLSADVFTGVLHELAGDFERSAGHRVSIIYGTAGAMRDRVRAGEVADVAILPRPMLVEVQQFNRIAPGSIVDLAQSAVAVAVRTGAPKPDIESVDAFTRSLLAARSISYPDPKRGGATGMLVTQMLGRLGMTDAMKSKTKFPPVGQFAVDLVARGEAEMAISQPMEVLAKPGVELVGLLPPPLQDLPSFMFSASVLTTAQQSEAGAAFIHFLTGPHAAAVLKAKGMSPK